MRVYYVLLKSYLNKNNTCDFPDYLNLYSLVRPRLIMGLAPGNAPLSI